MTTAAARPASFDARVMAYVPGLQNLAKKYRFTSEHQNDLVTDTIIYALGAWQNFREDGSMWAWLAFCMRGVVADLARKGKAQRRAGRAVPLTPAIAATKKVEPSQHHHVELKEALGRLRRIKGGNVVVRRALGDKYRELSARTGQKISNLETITKTARAKLMQAA